MDEKQMAAAVPSLSGSAAKLLLALLFAGPHLLDEHDHWTQAAGISRRSFFAARTELHRAGLLGALALPRPHIGVETTPGTLPTPRQAASVQLADGALMDKALRVARQKNARNPAGMARWLIAHGEVTADTPEPAAEDEPTAEQRARWQRMADLPSDYEDDAL